MIHRQQDFVLTRELVTIISAIIAAIIAAWFIQDGSRFEPRTAITIRNYLPTDVRITVNGKDGGVISPQDVKSYALQEYVADIDYSVDQIILNGDLIGERLSGHFENVSPGQTIYIDNIIEEEYYFLIIRNLSLHECHPILNEGWPNEKAFDIIIPPKSAIRLGYYLLSDNTNVTVYCNSKRYSGGAQVGNTPSMSIRDRVQRNSGVIAFIID